ncbi:MAG: SurA N-terminal domain-containing protein [Armatimonadetes bacterium]|nr:SurA N-terminal domain-containing protein [Armatimonadota bacterium]
MKSIGLFLLAATTAAGLTGCGGKAGGETIANFNGKPIEESKYYKQLETMDSIAVVLPNGQTTNARPAQPLSSQALGKLIERQVVLQAAKDQGVLPSKEDVEKEKTLRSGLNPQFFDQMRALGYSGDDINESLQVDLALYQLSVKGQQEKTIADAEKFVKENPERFRQPATASLRWIVLNNPSQRQAVDKALINATFGAAATQFSTVPSAKVDNGAFNPAPGSTAPRPVPVTDTLGPELLPQVKKTGEGEASGWFQFRGKWVKIKVEGKTVAQQTKPSAGQLELIRRALTQQDAKGSIDVQKILLDKLLAADVKITRAHLKKNWDTLVTALKQRTAELGESAPSQTSEATKPKK